MQVGNKRVDMIEDWEHRWEYLQLSESPQTLLNVTISCRTLCLFSL